MKIKLVRTEEPDGKWFKITGAGEWPLKIIKFDDSNEMQKSDEASRAFDEIVEKATKLNITVIKSKVI